MPSVSNDPTWMCCQFVTDCSAWCSRWHQVSLQGRHRLCTLSSLFTTARTWWIWPATLHRSKVPVFPRTLVFTRLLHNSRTIMRSFPPLYASDLVVHSDMDLGHEIWPVFVSCLGVCWMCPWQYHLALEEEGSRDAQRRRWLLFVDIVDVRK